MQNLSTGMQMDMGLKAVYIKEEKLNPLEIEPLHGWYREYSRNQSFFFPL